MALVEVTTSLGKAAEHWSEAKFNFSTESRTAKCGSPWLVYDKCAS